MGTIHHAHANTSNEQLSDTLCSGPSSETESKLAVKVTGENRQFVISSATCLRLNNQKLTSFYILSYFLQSSLELSNTVHLL